MTFLSFPQVKKARWRRIFLFGPMAGQWSSWWGRWGRETRCLTFEIIFVEQSLWKIFFVKGEGVGRRERWCAAWKSFWAWYWACNQVFLNKYSHSPNLQQGCWWGLNYLPIDHMTSSSTGILFVFSRGTTMPSVSQLCNGLHKDWRCSWKPSRL